eukprot:1885584-Alexandrium_andersonii.AAC.1
MRGGRAPASQGCSSAPASTVPALVPSPDYQGSESNTSLLRADQAVRPPSQGRVARLQVTRSVTAQTRGASAESITRER